MPVYTINHKGRIYDIEAEDESALDEAVNDLEKGNAYIPPPPSIMPRTEDTLPDQKDPSYLRVLSPENNPVINAFGKVVGAITSVPTAIQNKITDFGMKNIVNPVIKSGGKKLSTDVEKFATNLAQAGNEAGTEAITSFENPINPIGAVISGVKKTYKTAKNAAKNFAPFASQVDKEIQGIAKSRKVDLPVGAQTTSPAVQSAEALLAKGLLGKGVETRYNKALERIKEIGGEIVSKTGEVTQPTRLGMVVSESIKKFNDIYKKTINGLYSRINENVLKNTTVNTSKTEELLKRFIDEAKAAVKGGASEAEKQIPILESKLNSLMGNPKEVFSKIVNESGNPLSSKIIANKPNAYQVREAIKKLNQNYSDELVVMGDKAKLNAYRNSLNNDFLSSLPKDQANKLAKANSMFIEKLDKIDTAFNNSIKRLADNGKYEDIIDLVKNGSVQDIQTLFQSLRSTGNVNHINNIQATLLDDILKKAGNKPLGIERQLNKYGETASKIFTKEQLSSLIDIDKLNKAMNRVGRIKEGSQTAYLYRIYDAIKGLGKPLIIDVIGNSIYLNKNLKKMLLQGMSK